jgi:5-(carboxyamino)imidazole ribonucleotide synthase
MKKIGILGGGQLGLLLAQSLTRLGATVLIYEPEADAPACKTAFKSFHAPWNDLDALEVFVTNCDAVTYEFENVDSDALAQFATGKTIIPNPSVLKTTQNRAREKNFLRQSGLPHLPFDVAEDASAVRAACQRIGYPLILKSASGGYDGKLQIAVQSESELDRLLNHKSDTSFSNPSFFPTTIERRVELAMELSCITARSPRGEEITFPVFENAHSEHILDTTLCPARIDAELSQEIARIALDAARKLGAHGLLCTEFFLSTKANGYDTGITCGDFVIYINEFAPRPHNSGHVTISACTMSQFDALARILLGVPLLTPQVVAPGYFCMGNILGDVWSAQGKQASDELDLSCLANHSDTVAIILYGKSSARPKRKMGHFVTYALEAEKALASVQNFRQSLKRRTVAVN